MESSGILRWIVKGAVDYCRNGLGLIPDAVNKATEQYLEDNDPACASLERIYSFWHKAFPQELSQPVRSVIAAAKKAKESGRGEFFDTLIDAAPDKSGMGICSVRLGYLLKKYKDRPVDGYSLQRVESFTGVAHWIVKETSKKIG